MRHGSFVAFVVIASGLVCAQDITVRGAVNVVHPPKGGRGSGDVVVWLTPAEPTAPVEPGATVRLVQRNKRFTPHVLAVTVGTPVEFPNQDPFFHNVFSIYQGKPFDLGLYESGSSRKVRFTQPGVSYIFCNIHPEMSAAVVALRTPYFAVTSSDGSFHISHVPPGAYKLELWYDLASKQELSSLVRSVELSSQDVSLPAISLHSTDAPKEHLNKYGEPYPQTKTNPYE
jgi:plastocyanin